MLQKLSHEERSALWRRLNKGKEEHEFIVLLRPEELPKRVVRAEPAGKRPAGKLMYWCCYCGDWQPFEVFAFTGATRCIACGMSAKDFHNRTANNLWKVE